MGTSSGNAIQFSSIGTPSSAVVAGAVGLALCLAVSGVKADEANIVFSMTPEGSSNSLPLIVAEDADIYTAFAKETARVMAKLSLEAKALDADTQRLLLTETSALYY